MIKIVADEIGLMFLCFESDLSSQFNFIQQTWSNEALGKIKQCYDPDNLFRSSMSISSIAPAS